MTLSSTTAFVTLSTDSLNKTFPYGFIIYSLANLELWITDENDVEMQIVTNFSVTGIGNPAGGTFTYPVTGDPIASGSFLTLRRNEPNTQLFDPENLQPFNAESVELQFDKVVALIQQLQVEIDRSVKVGVAFIDDPADFLSDIRQAVSDAQTAAASASGDAASAASSASDANDAKNAAEAAAASVEFKSDQQTMVFGQQTVTLPWAIVGDVKGQIVFVDGVFQQRDTYNIIGYNQLAFVEAFSGDEILTVISLPFVS
jgi:hypothetical protein